MVNAIRVATEARPTTDAVWAALAAIPDPEIPVISLVELGVVRDVAWRDDQLVVTLTPTYSGCPATKVIAADVAAALAGAGILGARIETRLSPPWTTDWIAPCRR
jgi:ring-1,2-phenylacetyl-CoA epoxidase subunit PaaD